jgi:gamma-glutamyltranspeptidase/glutathione hydrolase
MGPPSSGAIAIGQILGIAAPYGLAALGPENPQSWRILGDATRLAFADRELYIADPAFVKQPKGLLDPAYLAGRARLIRVRRSGGDPAGRLHAVGRRP